MSDSRSDLNYILSWVLALWFVAELAAPMWARVLSSFNWTMEKAAVCWSRVQVIVVPTWPMGRAINFTRPQYLLKAAKRRGEDFLFFFSNLMSQPRSLHTPISTMLRVHFFLSNEVGSGEGVSRTSLA